MFAVVKITISKNTCANAHSLGPVRVRHGAVSDAVIQPDEGCSVITAFSLPWPSPPGW